MTAIVVYSCPRHGHPKLVIETESGSGTRLFGPKCCERGYAHELARWNPTAEQWQELVMRSEDAADEAAVAEAKRRAKETR